MSAWAAFRDGVRRVNGAPWVVLGASLLTLLVALPLSIALRGMLEAHLGPSLEADAALRGVNFGWWQEFQAHASGLATTFVPSIIGFGAVLDNLSGLLDNQPLAATVAGAAAAWLVLWSFLSGGFIDRLARARPTRAHGFFTACGVHFWRFVRLGAIALIVYAFLFGYVHEWIFERALGRLARDLTVERTAFLLRLGAYALFGALLVLSSLVFDYARIRIVVEDRRSAVAALAAGARFARSNPGGTLGVYLLNGFAFVLLVLLYAVADPGAPHAGLSTWLVIGMGQAFVLARHYLKLLFYASQTSLFQSRLAHAAYVAAPSPAWPDSPSAEAIADLDPTRPPDPSNASHNP